MALSSKTKTILVVAMANKTAANELSSAVDAMHVAAPAAHIAAIGVTANLVGVDGTGSNAAPLAGTESRLDVIEAKIDAVIAALIAAGLMS